MKKPYIPIYLGDWLKDTDCLSLEAEGALLRILFKLWESKTPGRLSFSFSQLSFSFRKSEEITRKIVAELAENQVLNIIFEGENRVFFESRRMVRDFGKSLIYSENGKKGGRPKKQIESKPETKLKPKTNQIPDNDNDNDNSFLEKGEGKTFLPAPATERPSQEMKRYRPQEPSIATHPADLFSGDLLARFDHAPLRLKHRGQIDDRLYDSMTKYFQADLKKKKVRMTEREIHLEFITFMDRIARSRADKKGYVHPDEGLSDGPKRSGIYKPQKSDV